MGEIKVPVETLQETAGKMEGLLDGCEDIFERIENMIEQLLNGNDWRGEDMDALIVATSHNRNKYEEMLKEMKALAEQMKNFAEDMGEADERIRKKIESVT